MFSDAETAAARTAATGDVTGPVSGMIDASQLRGTLGVALRDAILPVMWGAGEEDGHGPR
jgi:hypothetical protein